MLYFSPQGHIWWAAKAVEANHHPWPQQCTVAWCSLTASWPSTRPRGPQPGLPWDTNSVEESSMASLAELEIHSSSCHLLNRSLVFRVERRAEGEGKKIILSRFHIQCGAWLRVQSHNPEIMTWAETKGQMLNWLSHSGAPAQCLTQNSHLWIDLPKLTGYQVLQLEFEPTHFCAQHTTCCSVFQPLPQ